MAGAVQVRTLEDELIELSVDQVISPDYFKVIKGKGMPILNDDPLGAIKKSYEKGNLVIKFDIQFPTNMSKQTKEQLSDLIDQVEEDNQMAAY
mmetsp:Transcript_8648/g.14648  ORF Transcript_8648/g.14648 Transcript_8648/m.14648 type:complete len:93 (-) Transcript_8648:43-321(-)